MRSANASLAHSLSSGMFDPEREDFSENTEVVHLITSSKIKSKTNLNRLDEICGNITDNVGDLPVSKGEFDR